MEASTLALFNITLFPCPRPGYHVMKITEELGLQDLPPSLRLSNDGPLGHQGTETDGCVMGAGKDKRQTLTSGSGQWWRGDQFPCIRLCAECMSRRGTAKSSRKRTQESQIAGRLCTGAVSLGCHSSLYLQVFPSRKLTLSVSFSSSLRMLCGGYLILTLLSLWDSLGRKDLEFPLF